MRRELTEGTQRALDDHAQWMAQTEPLPKGAPAPRRGPSPTKGTTIVRAETTKVRKRLADAVRRSPGSIANIYAAAVAADAALETREVRAVLEAMIREGLLLQNREVRNGRTYDNVYPPVYKLHGREATVREIHRSPHNVHGLSYNTVRERLLAGMEPKAALATPPSTKGQVRAAVANASAPRHSPTDEGGDEGW